MMKNELFRYDGFPLLYYKGVFVLDKGEYYFIYNPFLHASIDIAKDTGNMLTDIDSSLTFLEANNVMLSEHADSIPFIIDILSNVTEISPDLFRKKEGEKKC